MERVKRNGNFYERDGDDEGGGGGGGARSFGGEIGVESNKFLLTFPRRTAISSGIFHETA